MVGRHAALRAPRRRLRHRARRRGGGPAPRGRPRRLPPRELGQPRAAPLPEVAPEAARLRPRLLPPLPAGREERDVGRAGGPHRRAPLHRVRDALLVAGQRAGERRDPRTERAPRAEPRGGHPPEVGRPAGDRRRRPEQPPRLARARGVPPRRLPQRGGRGARALHAPLAPRLSRAREGRRVPRCAASAGGGRARPLHSGSGNRNWTCPTTAP